MAHDNRNRIKPEPHMMTRASGTNTNYLPPGAPMIGETLSERLSNLHQVIATRHPEINRVALAIHDPDTDLLKTYVQSSAPGVEGLFRYEARLSDVPSLLRLAQTGEKRIIHDLKAELGGRQSAHSRWALDNALLSSYTIPVFNGERFVAFLFFDANQVGVFTPEVVTYLDLLGYLAAQMYLTSLLAVRTLTRTVDVVRGLTRIRDIETGHHLDRIAHYTRIITRGLSGRPGLDDEFTEHVFLFAPLHDIGKIGIPDSILQKPGRLTLEERHIMQRHVEIGVEAFDRIIADMSLSEDRAVTIMRNIIAYHHETLDGQGYPYGIGGNDLPLEARIVAVADVFDALTSERPYKRKWTNEEAFAELLAMVERGKLDAECVTSFIDNLPLIEETQLRFTEHEVLSP